jgi:hypothetical protein
LDDDKRNDIRVDSVFAFAERLAEFQPNAIIVIMKATVPFVKVAMRMAKLRPVYFKAISFPRYYRDENYVGKLAQILAEIKNDRG